MGFSEYDTIVAQITPPGRGAVGILRISGDQSEAVALKILGKTPKVKYINYLSFFDSKGFIIDQGIVLWFLKPHSYTGENVLELQGHGSPVILDLLMQHIISIPGVRIARPGEFSERAFLNGKLDLAQAESIMDIINASSEQAAKLSLKSLQGLFSIHIHDLIKNVIQIRVDIESEINFSEENIHINFEKNINDQLQSVISNINHILDLSKKGSILRESKKIVIIGHTNAGKSSLFNVLSCTNAAIVTDIQGTTRDLLHEHIHIHGIPFELVDTAGLRTTEDTIEKIGIERAWKIIDSSEYILFVIDSTLDESIKSNLYIDFIQKISQKHRVIVILNKSDLLKRTVNRIKIINEIPFISVSAYTGDGIEFLRNYLQKLSIGVCNENIEGLFLARRRHLYALEQALKTLSEGKKNWMNCNNIELLAEDLCITQNFLGQILGLFTTDNLLNSIFSDFCIGK